MPQNAVSGTPKAQVQHGDYTLMWKAGSQTQPFIYLILSRNTTNC